MVSSNEVADVLDIVETLESSSLAASILISPNSALVDNDETSDLHGGTDSKFDCRFLIDNLTREIDMLTKSNTFLRIELCNPESADDPDYLEAITENEVIIATKKLKLLEVQNILMELDPAYRVEMTGLLCNNATTRSSVVPDPNPPTATLPAPAPRAALTPVPVGQGVGVFQAAASAEDGSREQGLYL